MKKTKYAVFIGRFQPIHNGHLAVIKQALATNDYLILIIGSAFSFRSNRNMFSQYERRDMILSALNDEQRSRVIIRYQEDVKYNDEAWVSSIVDTVAEVVVQPDEEWEISLIGYGKDKSSYYIHKFPQWNSINYIPDDVSKIISATDIRRALVKYDWTFIYKNVPYSVFLYLTELDKSITDQIRREWDFIEKHNKMWEDVPYPISFNTVDAVVVQSSHVLLIRRRAEPGKNTWAMPSGYLALDETHEDSMLRELEEETKIDVPRKVLRGNIKTHRSFGDPNRSDRGRLITEAFLIKLPDAAKFPKVKGSDDADKAKWVHVNDLKREEMFEDHYDIIVNLLRLEGRSKKS